MGRLLIILGIFFFILALCGNYFDIKLHLDQSKGVTQIGQLWLQLSPETIKMSEVVISRYIDPCSAFEILNQTSFGSSQSQSCGRIKPINVTNVNGPLKHLQNRWFFKEVGNKSEVHFYVDFELKNKILNLLMSRSFNIGLKKIANAFENRAVKLFNNAQN